MQDRRVHLAVPEMLEELRALRSEPPPSLGAEYPFFLMAGERRAYNANQIFRDPAWRRVDHHGAMRMHPEDALALGLVDGAWARCVSARGEISVVVQVDDSVRPGVVTLPHGYGQRDNAGQPIGPVVNRLTATGHCDPLSKTPFHKYVPVRVRAMDQRSACTAGGPRNFVRCCWDVHAGRGVPMQGGRDMLRTMAPGNATL